MLTVIVGIDACVLKFWAFVLRIRIRWAHAAIFALLIAVLSLAAKGFPVVLGAGIAFAVEVAAGAWFFGERARLASTAQPIGWARGAALVALAQATLIGVGILVIWLGPG
ncbi:MAG TPA: hypothetical protein VFV97_00220 [Rhodanobacteraceae bacterium]|nr:hypothetical protein [Rhodanobacteraceae bacterium]